MKYYITTPRTRLRAWTEDDAEFFFHLNNDPEVMRYVGEPPFESQAHALEFVRNYSHFQDHGFGRWLVEDRNTSEPLGWCGLKKVQDGSGPTEMQNGFIDLGYRFARKHWGQGLATETSLGSLAYGFEKLSIPTIIGRSVPQNKASVRVLEKVGMEHFWEGECDLHHAYYLRITGAAFHKVRSERFPGFSVQFE